MASGEEQFPSQDQLLSLLGIYAAQFSAYTSLVWQVPALSLTAQSFLLVIGLSHGNDQWARLLGSGLSIGIAYASWRLMHDQRGHAINHGLIAKRIAAKLRLAHALGGDVPANGAMGSTTETQDARDAVPKETDAEKIWTAVDRRFIYFAWSFLLLAFVIADAIIIVSVLSGLSWVNARH